MLLKHRKPRLQNSSTDIASAYRHLDGKAVAVLRWLVESRIDFVLVGGVARAIRRDHGAAGPVAIVPAPYGRNLDRLADALHSAHAKMRLDRERTSEAEVKMNPDKLLRATRWALRCGEHDIDIEGRPRGVPRYQELLYEANRHELAEDLAIQVASPEDIEHYEHVRLTGTSPEIRISRSERAPTG
jgi:hypothetical protein